jgi:hypothetical protein
MKKSKIFVLKFCLKKIKKLNKHINMEKHKIEAELNAVLKSGCISTIFSVKLVI